MFSYANLEVFVLRVGFFGGCWWFTIMAVASVHLGVWSCSRQSPELQTECQNGEKKVI